MCVLLVLRETALLIDPDNSSSAAKQWVALVVGKRNCLRSCSIDLPRLIQLQIELRKNMGHKFKVPIMPGQLLFFLKVRRLKLIFSKEKIRFEFFFTIV